MNIHPLFVYFPIAFFVLYVVIEVCTPKKDIDSPWHLVKTVLLVAGRIGAQIALSTGEMAADQIGETDLLEMHELFANITTIVFGINAAIYVWDYIVQRWDSIIQKYKVTHYLDLLITYIKKRYLHIVLAVIGLIAVTYTGALWWALVYGVDVDPVVHFLITTLPGL